MVIIYYYISFSQSQGFTPNGDISFLGALGIGVRSGIGGSSSAVVVRGLKSAFSENEFPPEGACGLDINL